MSNWYVGQKVVCVDAYRDELIRGATYTVSGIDTCCTTWLSFVELPIDFGPMEACDCGSYGPGISPFWLDTYFRPLDTLEQDIERIESEGCPEPELQEA